ncbi:MAG TPA: hypothetical protein PLN33_15080 [Hyphomonadaceae bacterium]|jgi:hypothetical protein|nr:hypothetical protein [Hyphomonadaceae bacterium]
MTVINPWILALPLVRTEEVIGTLVQGFRELAATDVADFQFDLKEPDITKRLTRHLQTILTETLVSGFWDFEINQVRKNMTDPRRLDICYSTVEDGTNVRLIFECKKLYASTDQRARRHRNGYLNEGVSRFVTGSYAPQDPAAFMVGFVDKVGRGAVRSLVSTLSKGSAVVDLCLREYSAKKYWRAPPALFADHALFETCHLRASTFPEITLYHLELDFPRASLPKVAKSR